MQLDHTRAPLYEAMKEYQLDRVVKFDVPGHKGGRGNKALRSPSTTSATPFPS